MNLSDDKAGRSGIAGISRLNILLLGLGVAQFILLLAVVFLQFAPKQKTPLPPPPTSTPAATEPFFCGNPGPWGELEYVRINIEPPQEFEYGAGWSPEKPHWFFAGYTKEQLTTFFNSCDLKSDQRKALLDTVNWTESTNGVIVAPDTRMVLDLSATARARIYSVLAENEQNSFQLVPFTYRVGGFDDWFGNGGLSNDTIVLLKRLVYRRGDALCFSDMPTLFELTPDEGERKRIFKVLSRESALMMKLRIRPDTDVEALTTYWGVGRRAKDINPLLRSLTKVPGSITVDVAHLLPAFARKRLNTYAMPETFVGKPPPDCVWTTMNFFNDPPDDRFASIEVWQKEVSENYVQTDTPSMGDLVFLLHPDGRPFHMAVYIADDVVFTKNGAGSVRPWILMKMDALLASYPANFKINLVYLHRKAEGN